MFSSTKNLVSFEKDTTITISRNTLLKWAWQLIVATAFIVGAYTTGKNWVKRIEGFIVASENRSQNQELIDQRRDKDIEDFKIKLDGAEKIQKEILEELKGLKRKRNQIP